jgi:trypsin
MNFMKWISLGIIGLSMAAQAQIGAKIVGGVQATQGEFPFIVSLQQKGFGHFCGGSLISQKWVLTAAHCIGRGVTGGIDEIWIGSHDHSQSTSVEKMKVVRVIKHPKNSSATFDYDVALVELAQNSSFKPVALNETEIVIGGTPVDVIMAITAGWGAEHQADQVLPDILRKVDVPLVSKTVCNQTASYAGRVTDQMICAGYAAGGKDSCQGDSGGPLVLNDASGNPILVGVVSWGQGCALKNKYGVYAKVNSVVEWVKTQTGL